MQMRDTSLEQTTKSSVDNESTSGNTSEQSKRVDYLQQIEGNIDTSEILFNREGAPSKQLISALNAFPFKQVDGGRDLGDLVEKGELDHPQVEELLQQTFFRPTEAQFSFETAEQGAVPSDEQLSVIKSLGMVGELTVPHGSSYDTGVVFGGLLGAIDSRTNFMLQQKANLKSIALLGSERKIIEDREGGDKLQAVIGDEYYRELEADTSLPKTEFEIMQCVWESYCRKDDSLRALPIIEVNSEMRLGKVKEAPGTPNTVVDLANTLTSGYQISGLGAAPTSFLLASSQPFAARQREDFLTSMAVLMYPGLSEVSVVGYPPENTPSVKLFGTEIAKWVHAQYLARYS